MEDSREDVGVCGSDGDDVANIDHNSADSSGKKWQPIMEGRRWRLKTVGDGFVIDEDGRGMRGIVPVSVRGRCTLEKICKFN